MSDSQFTGLLLFVIFPVACFVAFVVVPVLVGLAH